MIGFVVCALLLAVLASAFVVPVLWRQDGTVVPSQPMRWTAVCLVTVLVLGTAGLYLLVGEPRAWDDRGDVLSEAPPPSTADGGMTQAQIEGMVARLAQRLQNQPDDAAGWRMLAKSYETLGRFPQAVEAYKHLLALQQPDPDLLTDYAVTLGMSLNQTLVGEPEAVIRQALQINPNHVQALALSGSADFEKRDYAQAMAQWRHLLSLVPPDADIRASIERNIAKAQSLAERDAEAQTKGARP
jgi:cytochrome c-type biogenesis protein CcmH/NrfG